MDLGYNRTRQISTDDLPGVFDPPLTLEVLTNVPYRLTQAIMVQAPKFEDDGGLKVIAAELIQGVTSHEGEYYALGSLEMIEAFVEATDIEVLRAIIGGWFLIVSAEKNERKKKSQKPSPASNSTPPQKSPAKQ